MRQRILPVLVFLLAALLLPPLALGKFPALSLPCGTDEAGLPVGAQLMGKVFSEPLLYRIGAVLERAAGYVKKEAE